MKVSFLIIGTTIGAGFASGREIWEFFTSYGTGSSIYVLLSMLLFSISCYIIMSISHELKAPHYVHVLEALIGKTLGRVYDVLIFFYLLSTTVVMFAGSGATLQYWSISYWVGVALISVLVWLVFLRNVEVMISLNSILIPIMIMTLMLVCGLFIWGGFGERAEVSAGEQIFPSAIAFTALNILPLIAVLSAIGSRMQAKEIKVASIGSAVGLCSIALLYNESLLNLGNEIMLYEVPLFAILRYFSDELMIGVTFILWLAIFTTAISGMFGLVTRFKSQERPQWLTAAFFILCIIPLTVFGFTNLIKVLYPLYGVLNLFILMTILLYPLAKQRKMR
nr:hypothetical protein [Caldalkalibacillus salinus]